MTKDDEDEDNSSVLRDVIVQMFDFPLFLLKRRLKDAQHNAKLIKQRACYHVTVGQSRVAEPAQSHRAPHDYFFSLRLMETFLLVSIN